MARLLEVLEHGSHQARDIPRRTGRAEGDPRARPDAQRLRLRLTTSAEENEARHHRRVRRRRKLEILRRVG